MKTNNSIALICCLVFAGLSKVTYALPAKCLQAVERQNACPHLLYKKAALAVAPLDVDKGDVICICLSDLKVLQIATKSQIERIDQQVTLQRMAEKYQLTEQDFVTLIRY